MPRGCSLCHTHVICSSLNSKHSLLADVRGRHQLLDEVVQPHLPLLDESCRWREEGRSQRDDEDDDDKDSLTSHDAKKHLVFD